MSTKFSSIDPQIQSWVDQQLQESGAYSPLELLLQSVRLDHSDYDAWRRGEMETLDSNLRGNPKKIKQQLQAADSYARHLKLIAEEEDYFAWQEQGEQLGKQPATLRVSIDKELRTLLGLRFVKQASGPQLDMFFNNPVVTLVNSLQTAFAHGDCGQAQKHLDKLYQTDPNHSDLAYYDNLIDVLRHSVDPVSHAARELKELQNAVPHAKRLLGLQARDFLAPLWRRLAAGFVGQAFDPNLPDQHESYAWYQAQDWRKAIDAIQSVDSWQSSKNLLLLLAECAFRQHDSTLAFFAWARLCWYFPEGAEVALNSVNLLDQQMRERWQLFLDNDQVQTLTVEDFPAWILLEEPSLVKQLTLEGVDDNGVRDKVFKIVYQLLSARLVKDNEVEIQQREQLKRQRPPLFACMMKKV